MSVPIRWYAPGQRTPIRCSTVRPLVLLSCDIARAVSRRLRDRRERLAPTARRLRGLPTGSCRVSGGRSTVPERIGPRHLPEGHLETALPSDPSAASAAERERL